ncbi:KH domain protein [Cooperia oncophora]
MPPPFPFPFYIRPPSHIPNNSTGLQRAVSPLPLSLPLTITSLKSSKNMRRRSSGSSAQSISCAASTSSASNCEAVSSQDSGRATGGLASSLSPMDEAGDVLPMYEFEIPNTLVGLVIGIKGKTIKELSSRTDVRMLIRQHHTPEKVDTHQICQVRGKREQINRCLQMLRRRFPPARFPELNLQPVLPPPLASNLFDALASQPSWVRIRLKGTVHDYLRNRRFEYNVRESAAAQGLPP